MGDIPLMTETGTFIINGTERVIVSQLHRSPGVFFDHDKGKTHSSGKLLYSARVIPYRGSWLDFEFDVKDILFCKIDRRRKLHATVLLRALGYTTQQILDIFYDTDQISIDKQGAVTMKFIPERWQGETVGFDVCTRDGTVLAEKDRRITARHVKLMQTKKMRSLPVPREHLLGKILAQDIPGDEVDESTGEILPLARANDRIDEALLSRLCDKVAESKGRRGMSIQTLYTNELSRGPWIANTLADDPIDDELGKGQGRHYN